MDISEKITVNGVQLIACHQDTDGSGEPLKCNSCYFLTHRDTPCPDCAFTGQKWYDDWHVIFKTVEENDEEIREACRRRDYFEDPRTYW